MSNKILINDVNVWAWGGDTATPSSTRFQFGNETGVASVPPLHTDHNFQMNRNDTNQQAILREGVTDYDSDEDYEPDAVFKKNGKLAKTNTGGTNASTNETYTYIGDPANVSTSSRLGTFKHTMVGNTLSLFTS
jgi:hypothetical protein